MNKHGFGDLYRLPSDSSLKSKVSHLRDIMGDLIYLVRKLRRIRVAQEIIAMGPMAVSVAFLLKLGLLPACKRMYWFGLFVHNPKWLRILRHPFRILDSERIRYVLFSEFEITLYKQSLSLSEQRMYYVPYGDLSEQTNSQAAPNAFPAKELNEGEFFFSGGYSNRDYVSLIEAFRDLPYKLIIICSKLNTEIDGLVIPAHVKIIRDVSSEVFDEYVKASKACLIPIANDTGAAGQSSLLRYMKNGKVIIATDTGIVREYLTNGVSGILVGDNRRAMANAVREVGANEALYKTYADAARERFANRFSGEAIALKLDEMINEGMAGNKGSRKWMPLR
jgi:glycosyltransferase involved in cell wall biosynthesis